MQTDRYGLELTTNSEAAAAAYREGMDCQLAAWPGGLDALDAAVGIDPDFALARTARARVHFTYGRAAAAKADIEEARRLASRVTERERRHIEILAASMEGQPAKALAGALAHLEAYPRDAFILSLPLGAFGLLAFSGRPDHEQAKVDLCERHARHYGKDWWFLTYLGWSHAENGNPGAGRHLIESAFEQRKANANAAHALAHAMFEQGASEDAQALLTGWLPDYDTSGILNGHISWHSALLALEQGDAESALAMYERRIRPAVSAAPAINVVTDGAALLWRTRIYGHAVPADLWQEVAHYAAGAFPKAGIHFIDVHYALIAAATGDRTGLESRLTELEARLEQGKLPPGEVVPALYRAVRAFADEHYAGAVAELESVMPAVVRVGGSHAQRELFEDTLIVAAMKAGQTATARRLIDERLHRRPSRRDAAWRAALAG